MPSFIKKMITGQYKGKKYTELPGEGFKLFKDKLDFKGIWYTNDGLYKRLEKAADKSYILNVVSRNQKTGNCFIKEQEKAIKYAFATRDFNKEQLESLRNSKGRLPFKPKWTPTTKVIHTKYIEQLKLEYPHLKNQLEEKLKKYVEKKNFASELGYKKRISMLDGTFRKKCIFYDNNNKKLGYSIMEHGYNNPTSYYDADNKKIGFRKDNNFYDVKGTLLMSRKTFPQGEKYYDLKGNLVGVSRCYGKLFFTELNEKLGVNPFTAMLMKSKVNEFSKVGDKVRTPLQEKMKARMEAEKGNALQVSPLPDFTHGRSGVRLERSM